MSYNLLLNNPKGLDLQIQNIQIRLQELDWLELSYGRAYLFQDNKRKFPYVKIEGNDYLEVYPNDNTSAQSFIIVTSEEKYLDFNNLSKGNNKEVNLSLIFWCNLDTLSKSIQELKQEVENKLRLFQGITLISFIDEKATKIFAEFEQGIDEKYLMHPYGGFRFNIKLNYFDVSC